MELAREFIKNSKEFRRLGDLVAFESRPGRWLGFHSLNLEVAELTPEAWETLAQPLDNLEIFSKLKSWNLEQNPNVKPGASTKNQDPATTKKQPHSVRSLTLNVNQICNLHCAYCAAGGDGTFGDPVVRLSVEKTLPQLRFFLEKVPAGESFRITFLGGEPLLALEGLKLVSQFAQELAQTRGIQISFTVVTNGTLFTAQTVEQLCKMKADITISIDGPAEINDVHRPSKAASISTTASVEKGLPLLLARKSELGTIGMSGTFGAHNLELHKAWQYYRQWPIDWFDFTYDHQETSSEISQKFLSELSRVGKEAFLIGGESELRKIKTFNNFYELLDQQQRVENFCGAGKSFLMIDARNNVYTCPWVVGDRKEIVGQGAQLFQNELDKYADSLIEKNNCQSCWARFLCGGGCMYMHKNKTGSKHQVDENFCDRQRSLVAQSLSFYADSRAVEEAADDATEETTAEAMEASSVVEFV